MKKEINSLPVKVLGYYEVFQELNQKDYLIGIFIIGESKRIELSINLYLDDIEIGNEELLLKYIGAIIPSGSKFTITSCE